MCVCVRACICVCVTIGQAGGRVCWWTECFISPLSACHGLYFHPLHHDIMLFHLFLSPWHITLSIHPANVSQLVFSFLFNIFHLNYFSMTRCVISSPSAWKDVPPCPFYLSHITMTRSDNSGPSAGQTVVFIHISKTKVCHLLFFIQTTSSILPTSAGWVLSPVINSDKA